MRSSVESQSIHSFGSVVFELLAAESFLQMKSNEELNLQNQKCLIFLGALGKLAILSIPRASLGQPQMSEEQLLH